jgi:hypothetical protein
MFQEKSGGKVIHRVGGVVFLYRGRHYDPRTRPRYPLMLWKPATPVYPKLIKEAPEGLTKEEADEMRSKGRNLPPICKLGINLLVHLILMDNSSDSQTQQTRPYLFQNQKAFLFVFYVFYKFHVSDKKQTVWGMAYSL